MSRAPHEMKNDLDELFIGREKSKGEGKKKSAIEHHQERINWVNEHLEEVLIWLGLDSSLNWKIESIIVTDYELSTPHIWSSPIPVILWLELCQTGEIN